MNKGWRPWHVSLLVCLAYVLLTLARYDFDPKYFALIGSLYDPGLPGGRPGYDGQFAYQIARDPVNGWTKIDVPAYRYQRIVYPVAARVLALGNPFGLGGSVPATVRLYPDNPLAAGGLLATAVGHIGGIIRNNFVCLTPGLMSAGRKASSDGALIAWNSPGTPRPLTRCRSRPGWKASWKRSCSRTATR